MIAVDTNLLVYAHREDSPWHEKALARVTDSYGGEHSNGHKRHKMHKIREFGNLEPSSLTQNHKAIKVSA